MTTLRLWWLLRRRSTGSSDPAGLTGVLAVIAFAVTTAIALVVVGGLSAFVQRAAVATGTDYDDSSIYVFLAIFATLLLLIPLGTLGGAAARLAVSRRDARLASLRLAGATTTQVAALTIGDAAVQALTGAVIGFAGYGALMPVVAQLRFQGRTFEVAELWVSVPGLLAAAACIVLVAGRVIDQRDAYRNLVFAGTDQRTLDQARFRETLIPLIAAVGSAAIVMLALAAPMVGFGAFIQPIVLIQYVLSIAAAVALVLVGSVATKVIARRVVA